MSEGQHQTHTPDPEHFRSQRVTATGAKRAFVELLRLETLWFNVGTLCNIECARCYIDSSPTNDRLTYLTLAEVERYLDEVADLDLGTHQIGFTGGEPFMNPDILAMLETSLKRGFNVLVLTNAMQPMMRSSIRRQLLTLRKVYGDRLQLRVSLDHYRRELHEKERGPRSWAAAIRGLRWLARNEFRWSVAGRTCWQESEESLRDGYAGLLAGEGLVLDVSEPSVLVLFPEMNETSHVPEITVDCWRILGVAPSEMMCASSRMVVRRRGAKAPTVVSCTLLPYDERFEFGPTLGDALGPVWLNHAYCSRFCVLGRGQCASSSLHNS